LGRKPINDEAMTAAERQRKRRARLRQEQRNIDAAWFVAEHKTKYRTRLRLAKLCGLLSSDYDGERAAAAAKITAEMKRLKLTWYDLMGLT
jgi:hypothetical protein